MRFLFQKGKTGGKSAYRDKDDEKNEYGDKDEKKKELLEGGVEVRVRQSTGGDLRVVASRCAIDEDTIIKEMSEGTIVDSLRKAVAAWRKEQSS